MSGAFLSEATTYWLADELAHRCTNNRFPCPVDFDCPLHHECYKVTPEDWREVLKAIPLYTQEKQEKKK